MGTDVLIDGVTLTWLGVVDGLENQVCQFAV